MKIVSVTKNRSFNTVREKLEFIAKSPKEPALFEPLRSLFVSKGHSNVEITHGNWELGKDLIFQYHDPLIEKDLWCAVIVKNKKAQQNDFLPSNEIGVQIQNSFKIPYTISNGEKIKISRVIVVVNGTISPQAKEVISANFDSLYSSNIVFWNYAKLTEEIEKFSKDSFLNDIDPIISRYAQNQIKELADVSELNNLFNLNLDSIEDIFIDVETSLTKIQKAKEEYLENGNSNHKHQVNLSADGVKEIQESKDNFIVHGIATSGKTLLLKRLGIKSLENNSETNAVFYFDFSKSKIAIDNFDILSLISFQYRKLSGEKEFDNSNFEKIYLLFDSIDDLNSKSDKIKILQEISDFTKKSDKKFQIVITLKSIDLLDESGFLENFKRIELMPFTLEQALKLAQKIIPEDTIKARRFAEGLKNTLLNSTILRTPLAITLIAILYRDGLELEEIPANITELYNKFTDTYLERWDNTKGISSQYKYDQIKIILSHLAYIMHEDGKMFITESDMRTFFQNLRKDYSYDQLDDVEVLINYLKSRKGIFKYNSTLDQFSFHNNFFQEYFASIYVNEENEDDLLDNFINPWWDSAIIFYQGREPKREVFLNKILKIIPIEAEQQYRYIRNLSTSLQASHAVSIKKRKEVIKAIISRFDIFYKLCLTDAKSGVGIISNYSTIDIIIAFRNFFEEIFDSKHILRDECFEIFDDILIQEKLAYSDVTIYCLAHFYSNKKNQAVPLELFLLQGDNELKDNLDSIWSKIALTDFKLLHLKAENPKLFARIKKRARKRRFEIQSSLKGIGSSKLLQN